MLPLPLPVPSSTLSVNSHKMGKDRLDEALDVANYATWAIRFEDLVVDKGYGAALLRSPVDDESMEMSNKVKSLMVKNVKDHHLALVNG